MTKAISTLANESNLFDFLISSFRRESKKYTGCASGGNSKHWVLIRPQKQEIGLTKGFGRTKSNLKKLYWTKDKLFFKLHLQKQVSEIMRTMLIQQILLVCKSYWQEEVEFVKARRNWTTSDPKKTAKIINKIEKNLKNSTKNYPFS